MIRKIVGGITAILGVAVIGAGIYTWDPLPARAPAEALSAAAANYDAEIIRDRWGVPHIYGKRDADTAFGLAYAHAEDDFYTIQETVAAGRGVMARYRGADAAPLDYIVSLLGVWDTMDARYESDVPDDVKAIAEAYVAGLNLYASEHPDETWAGLAPFTAEDVVAGFVFKTPFFYGLDSTLLDLFGDEHEQLIAMDPDTQRETWMPGKKTMAERGSNAFAVAPSRSTDGATRLFINSHQPLTGPVAWYEAHTISEEGMNMQGGLFPGTPVVLHGFNEHLGWANTVSAQDLVDVFVLTVNPEDDGQYKLDGEWVDFDVSEATLNVKLFGPFAFPVKRKVKRSVHGPVIEGPTGTYAVRYAGMGEIRQLEQYYRLNKTTDFESFQQAMSMNALPSINYVYGDKDGIIALIHNAQYPLRNDEWDWNAEMPGDRSDLVWEGYYPYLDGPQLISPQSGFVWNANNQPYSATDGPDNLRPGDFPQSMGLQTNETNRALRIIQRTDGETPFSEESLLELKFDTGYAPGSEADDVIAAVLEHDWSSEPDMAAAVQHLSEWDLRMDEDSRHAALGGLTVMREITQRFTGEPAPEPVEAFRMSVEYLKTHYGRIDPEWGELNVLARGDETWPISGGPDTLRAVYPAGLGEDGKLRMTAGDTWIALVTWAADGAQTAKVINNYGSAVLDETSPHYADQAPLFAGEEWREALLTRADIEADATRIYRPGRE